MLGDELDTVSGMSEHTRKETQTSPHVHPAQPTNAKNKNTKDKKNLTELGEDKKETQSLVKRTLKLKENKSSENPIKL